MTTDADQPPTRDDASVYKPRPMRDRPLMPNVWELAGDHRGERPQVADGTTESR
jgi:hypothetical protein